MTVGMGVRRFLLLVFFAYLALDFGSPFVPGVFAFDPADSVDAASTWRARSSDATPVVTAPRVPIVVRPLPEPTLHAEPRPTVRAERAWRPYTRGGGAITDRGRSIEDD